jgi:hypothetical protein
MLVKGTQSKPFLGRLEEEERTGNNGRVVGRIKAP